LLRLFPLPRMPFLLSSLLDRLPFIFQDQTEMLPVFINLSAFFPQAASISSLPCVPTLSTYCAIVIAPHLPTTASLS
jgi:hypothetical protein